MGKWTPLAIAFAFAQAVSITGYAEDCPPPRCDTMKTAITVGYAPGGPTDVMARRLAKALNAQWGEGSVLVENKVGAQGLIAASFVSKAPPDGGNSLLATSNLNAASALYAKLDFSPEKDLAPAALVASTPFAIAVSPSLNVRNVAELVVRAKQSPGKISYGSGGSGSMENLFSELFNSSVGIHTIHIPYKGGSQAALTELTSGRVDYVMSQPNLVHEAARQGKLRIIATTGNQRSPKLPDAPTLAELGMQELTVENRMVLYVPKSTSASTLQKWNRAVVKAIQSPEMKRFVEQQGASIDTPAPEKLSQLISSDTARWARIVRSANIKAE